MPKTTLYWKTALKDSIKKRFIDALSDVECSAEYDLRSQVSILGLYHRLQNIVGVKLLPEFLDKFTMNMESGVYILSSQINLEELVDLYPIVKVWHRLSFEEATAISKQAVQEVNEDFSNKLFSEAEKRYQETIKKNRLIIEVRLKNFRENSRKLVFRIFLFLIFLDFLRFLSLLELT